MSIYVSRCFIPLLLLHSLINIFLEVFRFAFSVSELFKYLTGGSMILQSMELSKYDYIYLHNVTCIVRVNNYFKK